MIFTDSALWAGSVIESPCPSVCLCVCAIGCSFCLGLSLANTGDMISSQACHWSMGAAVQPCQCIKRLRVQLFNQMIADTLA